MNGSDCPYIPSMLKCSRLWGARKEPSKVFVSLLIALTVGMPMTKVPYCMWWTNPIPCHFAKATCSSQDSWHKHPHIMLQENIFHVAACRNKMRELRSWSVVTLSNTPTCCLFSLQSAPPLLSPKTKSNKRIRTHSSSPNEKHPILDPSLLLMPLESTCMDRRPEVPNKDHGFPHESNGTAQHRPLFPLVIPALVLVVGCECMIGLKATSHHHHQQSNSNWAAGFLLSYRHSIPLHQLIANCLCNLNQSLRV